MGDAGTLTMSAKELSRIEILGRVLERRLTQRAAAERLDLSLRQVERLCRALRDHGAAGLVSRKRGGPSNHKLSEAASATSPRRSATWDSTASRSPSTATRRASSASSMPEASPETIPLAGCPSCGAVAELELAGEQVAIGRVVREPRTRFEPHMRARQPGLRVTPTPDGVLVELLHRRWIFERRDG